MKGVSGRRMTWRQINLRGGPSALRGPKNLLRGAAARPTRCAQLRGTWSLSGRCAALGCHGNGIQIFPPIAFLFARHCNTSYAATYWGGRERSSGGPGCPLTSWGSWGGGGSSRPTRADAEAGSLPPTSLARSWFVCRAGPAGRSGREAPA